MATIAEHMARIYYNVELFKIPANTLLRIYRGADRHPQMPANRLVNNCDSCGIHIKKLASHHKQIRSPMPANQYGVKVLGRDIKRDPNEKSIRSQNESSSFEMTKRCKNMQRTLQLYLLNKAVGIQVGTAELLNST
ncbi:hypothetical protein KIN20_031098 [Parelaphostrongylus tenuis]|uniref:Uncharacterized protein n=1 Tax=Parelaphostrongylus tenuis TaxID=148309 RepID=A0AAD5R518_PARTN|nr:hypothetical protein KIN20_031098 [Parelaphostrongylus tenuis]